MRTRGELSDLRARLQRVLRDQRRDRPTVGSWVVTGVALVSMVVTATLRTGEPVLPSPGLTAGILLAWAPLLVRTTRPLLALAGTVVAEVGILVFLAVPDDLAEATSGMGAYQPVPLASMLAACTVAARTPRKVGWVAGGAAGAVLMITGLLAQGRPTALTDLVVFYLVMTATGVGALVSSRRDARAQAVREREEATARAVLDERLRIARELHDVLAHNLTLVNAQAGVAEYLVRTRPEDAVSALRDITRHTGRAIDELRATVGLLRSDDEPRGPATAEDTLRPVPGLATLDDLVASFRSTGARVEVSVTGDAATLDQHADLAAYRILQEALTNAAKHSPGAVIEMHVGRTGQGVRLRVVNALPAADGRVPAPGTGHGLIGMRERAAAAGGHLRHGLTRDGRFEVVATLPAAAHDDTGKGESP